MLILNNRLGLADTEKTSPIVLYHDFMNKFFNIETEFQNKDAQFTITKRGQQIRFRYLNHITNSDIYSIIILHTVCHASTYNIKNVTYSNIYDCLCNWFEDPISFQEFLISMRKFELHQLISISNERDNGRFDVQLNVTEDEGKNVRFIVLHPIVFSSTFTDLELSHQKLFLVSVIQTGNISGKKIERKFDNDEHESVMFKGLKQLTHKQQSSDVRRIINDLLTKPMENGVPLFSTYKDNKVIEKDGRRFYKAVFCVNDCFVLKHEAGRHYHFPMKPVVRYKRFASFLNEQLELLGVAEHMSFDYKNTFMDMLYSLKDKGKTVAKFVLNSLKDYIDEKGSFHPNINSFIKEESKSKIKSQIINLAKEHGISEWISPNHTGVSKKDRIYYFTNSMSYYSKNTLKDAFKQVKGILVKQFSKSPSLTSKDYCFEKNLNQLIIINAIRARACYDKVSLVEYADLEKVAAVMLNDGEKKTTIESWMFDKLSELNRSEILPNVDDEFVLEDMIISLINKKSLS